MNANNSTNCARLFWLSPHDGMHSCLFAIKCELAASSSLSRPLFQNVYVHEVSIKFLTVLSILPMQKKEKLVIMFLFTCNMIHDI
jgi:hypothetical protein